MRGSPLRWTAACTIAQLAAALVLLAQAWLLGLLSESGEVPVALHIALELAIGGFEGLLLGIAQSLALGRAPLGGWSARTAGAFLLVWSLGALASYLEPAADSLGARLGLAAAAGLGLGAILGTAQTAPRIIPSWVLLSALGWAAGLVVAAIAADQVPWGPHGIEPLLWSLLGMGGAGLVYGLTTGPYAARLPGTEDPWPRVAGR